MLQRSDFIAIMPRHARLLEFLRQRLTVDGVGGIGWGACREVGESFTDEMLFSPLVERGLIRDCTLEMGERGGPHFVKVTPFGLRCMDFGLLPREALLGADESTLVGIIGSTLGGEE